MNKPFLMAGHVLLFGVWFARCGSEKAFFLLILGFIQTLQRQYIVLLIKSISALRREETPKPWLLLSPASNPATHRLPKMTTSAPTTRSKSTSMPKTRVAWIPTSAIWYGIVES